MKGFPTFKGLWTWPWLWIGLYCISSCIAHRPLPVHAKFHWNRRNVLWRDGRLRPTLLVVPAT